jgi:aconitate hydratase
VLIVRKAKSKSKEAEGGKPTPVEAPKAHPFLDAQTLQVVSKRGKPATASALVLESLDDVRWFARRAPELCDTVRAIVAPHIPSGIVPMLAGLGILALVTDGPGIEKLRAQPSLALPAPSAWGSDGKLSVDLNGSAVTLTWVALGIERDWTSAGSARSAKR